MGKESNVSFVVLVVACAIIWFGGAALQKQPNMGWATPNLRIGLICGVGCLWMLLYVWQKISAVRGARLIEQRLRAQAQEQVASTRPDKRPEVEALERQLNEAMAALKQSKLGASALYALPWYVIIGPPGSGKTTALLQSGLNFPYASQGGKIRGVGGTRNCDWWFTDTGILLDTAGRYTTELEDRDEWYSFLDMTKRARKKKPINGALVCISVADVVQANDEQLEAYAKNIRDRIDELTKRLELIFPVYLVFTKCDLLSGFVEFFEDFNKSDRGQVWGVTLPYKGVQGKGFQQVFEDEAKKLYDQLCAQRVAALAVDRSAEKKRQIYSFPLQFSLAHKRLAEFVGLLFKPNPFQESAAFRGFYFTSGTQEGTPIDQVLAAMGSAFGMKSEFSSFMSQTVDKKSYFITKLFNDIIFPDQNLARSSTAREKRARLGRTGIVLGSVAGLVLLSLAFAFSFLGNRGLVKDLRASIARVKDADKLPSAAERLDAMADLRTQVDRLDKYQTEDLPWSLRWGLYRGNELDEIARKTYWDRMNRMFVEPVTARLKSDMMMYQQKGAAKTRREWDELFQVHRVYQMLGGRKNVEPLPDVMERVLADSDRWRSAAGPSLTGEQSAIADGLLGYYIQQVFKTVRRDVPRPTLDENLIYTVRLELERNELTNSTFGEIRDAAAKACAPMDGRQIRSSGRELLQFTYQDFSELFTQREWDGRFHGEVRGAAGSLSQRYKDSGVEGKTPEVIEKDMTEAYATQYTGHWEKWIQGIEFVEFKNLPDASRNLDLLTGDKSPLAECFRYAWTCMQLKLPNGDVRNRPNDDPSKWVPGVLKSLRPLNDAIKELISRTDPKRRILSFHEQKKLEQLTSAFSGVSKPIEDALEDVDSVYRERIRLIVSRLTNRCYEALLAEGLSEVNAEWERNVYRKWKDEMAPRFPFSPDASEEVPLSEFTALFKPKTGALAMTIQAVEELSKVYVLQKPLIEPSPAFREGLKRLEALQRMLYRRENDKDADVITVQFTVFTESAEHIRDYEVSVGTAPGMTHRHQARMSYRSDLKFIQGVSQGAKLLAFVGKQDGEVVVRDFSTKQWGLLHLVRSGKELPLEESPNKDRPECTYARQWPVVDDVGGIRSAVKVAFQAESKDNWFDLKAFTELNLPEKVGP